MSTDKPPTFSSILIGDWRGWDGVDGQVVPAKNTLIKGHGLGSIIVSSTGVAIVRKSLGELQELVLKDYIVTLAESKDDVINLTLISEIDKKETLIMLDRYISYIESLS